MATGLAIAPAHEKLAGYFGISIEVQRRIGTFVLMSSSLEQNIEILAWSLKPEILPGKPIWTDKLQISQIIGEVTKMSQSKLPDSEFKNDLLSVLQACEDMLVVRHTIVHGRLRGRTEETDVMLSRNDSIIGETRNRERTFLSLKNDKIDEACHILDRLFMFIAAFSAAISGAPVAGFMLERLTDLKEVCESARAMREEALGL